MNIYPFYRLSIAAASLAVLTLPFSAAPAQASTGKAAYRAELAASLEKPRREIVDGVVWHCEGKSCAGSKSGSRPIIVCGRLAQKLGPIARFEHSKGELGPADLARCNGE